MQMTSPFTDSPLSARAAISENKAVHNNPPGMGLSTQVDISPQAQEKLAQEKNELTQKLELKKTNTNSKGVEESNKNNEAKSLDKLIEDTQDRIKEFQKKLRSLRSENSEEAKQEQKMLESQIMSLNAILISLFGKKLEALEQ
jgi:chromosome segregation ATPase